MSASPGEDATGGSDDDRDPPQESVTSVLPREELPRDEYWRWKKKARKQRLREAQREKKKVINDRWNAMSEEEKVIRRQELAVIAAERKAREDSEERRTHENIQRQGLIKVVIDLGFEDLMEDREARSTGQQCALSFSCCRARQFIVWPYFQGAPEGGIVHQVICGYPGFATWPCRPDPRPVEVAFANERHRLIYLTADSDVILGDLNPADIYVVGGFVDRNRQKGLTLRKAKEMLGGVRTARLPIEEEAFRVCGRTVCKVLTINHVVDVLARVADGESWSTAFDAVLPSRRRQHSDGS